MRAVTSNFARVGRDATGPYAQRVVRTANRSRFAPALLAAVLALAVGGIALSSASGARKHRNRTGTIVQTTTVAPTASTSGSSTAKTVTQLTLHPATTSRAATGATTSAAATPTNAATKPSNRTDPRLRAIGFRSQARLDDHYAKHGIEFGSITKAQYLATAQDLRDAPLSSTVLQATQADGTFSRFDRRTGAFLAYNTDLTIRTFFRPNDGEAYFRRAAGRTH